MDTRETILKQVIDDDKTTIISYRKYQLPMWMLPETKDTPVGHYSAMNDFRLTTPTISNKPNILDTIGTTSGIENPGIVMVKQEVYFTRTFWETVKSNIESMYEEEYSRKHVVQLKDKVMERREYFSISGKIIKVKKVLHMVGRDEELYTTYGTCGLFNRDSRRLQKINGTLFHQDENAIDRHNIQDGNFDVIQVPNNLKPVFHYTITKYNIDVNGHTNTALYDCLVHKVICELFSEEFMYNMRELSTIYRRETHLNDDLEVYSWLDIESQYIYCSIICNGEVSVFMRLRAYCDTNSESSKSSKL